LRGRAGPPPPPPVDWEAPEHRPCLETGRLQCTTAGRPHRNPTTPVDLCPSEHVFEFPSFYSLDSPSHRRP
jgi:hypothetical protein